MKVVFCSNYYNHHQKAFSEAMYNLIGDEYVFIQTSPITADRKLLGWNDDSPQFVLHSYESEEMLFRCLKLLQDADFAIIGSVPFDVEKKRLKTGKITFKYSERPYKPIYGKLKKPLRIFKYFMKYNRFNNCCLLCASAYASADYTKSLLFKNKFYKWGYFPETKRYADLDALMARKKKASILWAGRLIEWKHPDVSILLADRLLKDGYDFHLDIIGMGPLEADLKTMIAEKGLEGRVSMLGAMKPEEVRKHMEDSSVFLFTSDFNEGWGAVLNESMNSGCVAVASHAIGSVPYLIKDGENGLIYENGNVDDLYAKTKWLLDHPDEAKRLGKMAYDTLAETWNARIAAERFLKLSTTILRGGDAENLYENGPCSKAEIIKDNWFEK